MRYSDIAHITSTWLDYPDIESIAVEVFMQGCSHACEFCQNKELQTFKNNTKSYASLVAQIEQNLKKYRTNKIVFVGGEPLANENTNLSFIKRFLNDYGAVYDVCIYTGYNIEYVKKNKVAGFKYIKTGRYIPSLQKQVEKNEDYMQFASENQRLYSQELKLLTNKGKLNFKENK